MKRIDSNHLHPGKPHKVEIPLDKLHELLDLLQNRDIPLTEFVQKVSEYPAIHQQIVAAANSAADGRAREILDPAHAATYLGSRRLIQMLRMYAPEIRVNALDVERFGNQEY